MGFGGSAGGGSNGGGVTDYDDQADIVRFLEDGSFIGQYGRWPKQSRRTSGAVGSASRNSTDCDAEIKDKPTMSVSATALSTFV